MLSHKRLSYQPPIPTQLLDLNSISLKPFGTASSLPEEIRRQFPHSHNLPVCHIEKVQGKNRRLKVGVVFSGGPAAGGHNVIAALYDALRQFDPASSLIGFLDGPGGIIENRTRTLTASEIDAVRNQGGFDLIGSGRVKIETPGQLNAAAKAVSDHQLDGLVVIGGDDSNTNAAFLAEFFLQKGLNTRVIGVPKTIDGDLRSPDIAISFGFDSACKTYSELIGNIAKDALSAKKYIHFIKLMGRSASHIALECALSTAPNLALLGEEHLSLSAIVRNIADLIRERSRQGKEYGVILIPEGLIEFIPEMKSLIAALQNSSLDEKNQALFDSLPEKIRDQLLLERDPHGNVTVSQIETEALLLELVKREVPFNAVRHFFGYEGRSCLPTNFDANYSYALGRLAALAIRDQLTGGICAIQHLEKNPLEWEAKVVPLVQLMHFEMRSGKEKAVIRKTPVDLQGKPFSQFKSLRAKWRLQDAYRFPGPIQFFGSPELTETIPITIN